MAAMSRIIESAALYFINSVDAGPGDVAAIVRGVFQAPNYLEDQFFVARNAGGDPLITGNVFVPFVIALPQAAASGPVPVVMFQHGSPGSSEQVWWEAYYTLAAEGCRPTLVEELHRPGILNGRLQILRDLTALNVPKPNSSVTTGRNQ